MVGFGTTTRHDAIKNPEKPESSNSAGNAAVGLAGEGTLYADGGIEATAIKCAGTATIDALTVNQGIACGAVVVNGGGVSPVKLREGLLKRLRTSLNRDDFNVFDTRRT